MLRWAAPDVQISGRSFAVRLYPGQCQVHGVDGCPPFIAALAFIAALVLDMKDNWLFKTKNVVYGNKQLFYLLS